MHAFAAVLYFIVLMFHTFVSGSLHLLAAVQLQQLMQKTWRSDALLKGTYTDLKAFLFKFSFPD